MSLALALAIVTAEREAGLPPGLLAAVVWAESRGRNIVSRERVGGCSVGVAQIYVSDCGRERVRLLRNIGANLREGARQLAVSRQRCATTRRGWRVCRICPEALYNASGATQWCAHVHRVWRRIRAARALEPTVRRDRHPAMVVPRA